MMPPSLHDWLREDHLARFVADLMPRLDLSAFYASYEERDGRRTAAYHPVMMARMTLYGYRIGVVRSHDDQRISETAFESAGRVVSASAGAVSGGGLGEDGTCGVGWNQEAGERQQA